MSDPNDLLRILWAVDSDGFLFYGAEVVVCTSCSPSRPRGSPLPVSFMFTPL